MTAEKKYIYEYILDGLLEGLEKRLQRRDRKILPLEMRERFGAQVDTGVEQRIAAATDEQIVTWLDRVQSAETVDDLLLAN